MYNTSLETEVTNYEVTKGFLVSLFMQLLCFYGYLKDPSQPPPFSMPWKLLILHGEAKSDCFTIGCVPEGMFNYL